MMCTFTHLFFKHYYIRRGGQSQGKTCLCCDSLFLSWPARWRCREDERDGPKKDCIGVSEGRQMKKAVRKLTAFW